MKPKWKILITLIVLVLAGIGIYASTVLANRNVVTVQTARVVRQDLTSLVTASGEIKPKNYINIGANAMGQLTEILVKEGDRVRKGELLARIEDVQPTADVQAQQASVSSAEADSSASEAISKPRSTLLLTPLRSIAEINSSPPPSVKANTAARKCSFRFGAPVAFERLARSLRLEGRTRTSASSVLSRDV